MFRRKAMKKIMMFKEAKEIIVIHGARQTGKTSLMKLFIETLNEGEHVYFDLEDSRYLSLFEKGYEEVIKYLEAKSILKKGQKLYLFVDEIQYLNNSASFLKLMHDHVPQIKMIVSGSSSFDIKKLQDSLVGRTVNIELFPLDFDEFLLFKNVKYNRDIDASEQLVNELYELFREYVLYGGYPAIVLSRTIEEKEVRLQQIIDTYIRKDIRNLTDIRNVDKFNNLLRVLAAQTGNLLNITELANTAQIARNTVEEYLFILEDTKIIKKVTPFSRNIRSELFSTPKIFLYDTGITSMLKSFRLPGVVSGELFETAVFSELIKNRGNTSLHFWRTKDKKEIDFIIDTGNELLPLEVKMNAAKMKLTALKYFKEAYGLSDIFCTTFEGNLPDRVRGKINTLHPWELVKLIG